jgi:hypothetical protein
MKGGQTNEKESQNTICKNSDITTILQLLDRYRHSIFNEIGG